MKKIIPIMSALCALSVPAVSADEASKPAEIKRVPAHNPEWTNPKGSDPGTTDSVVPELQGIVVLCATKPQSAEFKKQWAAYVRRNYKPGMNIDAVINDVLRRADEYRAGKRAGSKGPATEVLQSPLHTKKMMHDTAKAVIQNMRA
jgi:hypothetical protein